MTERSKTLGPMRFGPFDLLAETGELRRNGARLKLSGQPLQVLVLLAAQPGNLVTRQELQRELWASDAFGDPEHGLNAAVNRLREVLGDSATEPRYIETVPGRGYRLVAALESSVVTPQHSGPEESSLFRRFFLLFGASPYRRWEIMHVRMFLWCLLLGYLGSRFWARTPDKWGSTLFFLELACIALLLILLSFLVYTGTFDRSSLPKEIGRLAPWIHWSTIALVPLTWAMAGTLVVSHSGLASLLAICGTAGGIKYAVYKPAIDRAAFPKPQ